MASQSTTPNNRTVTVAEEAHVGTSTTTGLIRINGKTDSTVVWDEFSLLPNATVPRMINRFKNNKVQTEGYFIPSSGGAPVTITIPPATNLVHFLRLMYAEQGSGKLYIPRQVSVWGNLPAKGQWDVILWGGGRQKARNIKVVEVLPKNVPKTIKLIEMVQS